MRLEQSVLKRDKKGRSKRSSFGNRPQLFPTTTIPSNNPCNCLLILTPGRKEKECSDLHAFGKTCQLQRSLILLHTKNIALIILLKQRNTWTLVGRKSCWGRDVKLVLIICHKIRLCIENASNHCTLQRNVEKLRPICRE